MNYRLSFIFRAGQSGWSEQWYLVASVPPALVPGTVLTEAFKSGFLGLRADGVILQALRVNDADAPRNSFLAVCNFRADDYNGAFNQEGEEPAVAALGYVLTASGKHRPVMVRGLIDAEVNRDQDDQVIWSGGLKNGLTQYYKAVLNAGLCIRYLIEENLANNPDRLVLTFAPKQNDVKATTITHVPGSPLDVDFPVIVHGLSRATLPGYQGPLPCYNGTATTVDVPVVWRAPATVLPMQDVYIRNAYYAYDPVMNIAWNDIRTKRVGRPTMLSRGRRPGIKYRAR